MFRISGSAFQDGAWAGPRVQQVGLHLFPSLVAHPGYIPMPPKLYNSDSDHIQFGHGLVTTVVGPTQPYLAQKTGVDIGTINLVWTFGFFGYMVTNFIIVFLWHNHQPQHSK